ncbi:hypothetical protein RI543_002591 [Arxiozyma heterogenica]|uniref:TAFII55 protein conserved region domain-containing protein n=1 Tax=Arxiozyma heterogenica TaxID=278026 RepID=A0AAN7W2Y6_9SACH|nr:hypothetical protein RI543_002591 [Kazachstania heterogenica]
MTVVKLKRSKTEESSEEPSQTKKKIKIKTKLNEDNTKVIPKIKINLKKENHVTSNNIVKKAGPIKIKLNLKKKEENNSGIKVKRHEPRVRVKAIRIPGEGYDSEDSDVESDPLIESGIILRVVPDTQVDFVKNSIEAGDYSGIGIKWVTDRHAVVMINGYMYGAILVDLPTIIEVNKSVDRKNLLKTFDISQMLLCIRTIDKEEEVFDLQVPDTEDLVSNHYEDIIQEIHREKIKLLRQHLSHGNHDMTPQQIDKIAVKSYDYKHGLTAPLYNVRNRRFRRKMNSVEFEYVENVVETLLNEDDKAEEVTFELITEEEINTKPLPLTSQSHLNLSSQQQMDSLTIKTSPPLSTNISNNSDSNLEKRETTDKGENIEEEEKEEEEDDDELDLEAAFESDEDDDEAKNLQEKLKNQNEVTSNTENKVTREGEDLIEGSAAEEGMVEEDESEEDEDEEDEEEEDEEEEDDDDDDNELGGRRNEKRQHIELLEDELKELESTLTQTIRKVEKATNPLLKSRFVESIKKLEKEVELKKKQLKANEESIQYSSKIEEDSTNNDDESQTHIDNKQQEQSNNDGEEDDDDDDDIDDDDDVEPDEDEEEEEEESLEDNNRDAGQEQTNNMENNADLENQDGSLDQNDLDMMMLFGAEAEEDEE